MCKFSIRHWPVFLELTTLLIFLAGMNFIIAVKEIDTSPLAGESTGNDASTGLQDKALRDTLQDITLMESVARPLFSPTRRDYVEPPPSPPTDVAETASITTPIQTNPPPSLDLKGTRILNGIASALVSLNQESVARWLQEGDKVGEWTVGTIEAHRMTINRGSDSTIFSLYDTVVE